MAVDDDASGCFIAVYVEDVAVESSDEIQNGAFKAQRCQRRCPGSQGEIWAQAASIA